MHRNPILVIDVTRDVWWAGMRLAVQDQSGGPLPPWIAGEIRKEGMRLIFGQFSWSYD